MASWTPLPSEVTGQVPAWEHAAVDDDVAEHAIDAVTEIVGAVGAFDPNHIINPLDDVEQQRTLGDLAHQAAELRAADLWVSGLAPEMKEIVRDLRAELFAKYQRALAALQRHINGGSDYTTGHFAGSMPMTRR